MAIIEKKVLRGPHYFEIEKVFVPNPPRNRKADRAAAVDILEVTIRGHIYQTDEVSLNRINWALGVASGMFARAQASGMTVAQAYDAVYIQTPVKWNTSDNVEVMINAETLLEVMEAGTAEMTQVWFDY